MDYYASMAIVAFWMFSSDAKRWSISGDNAVNECDDGLSCSNPKVPGSPRYSKYHETLTAYLKKKHS